MFFGLYADVMVSMDEYIHEETHGLFSGTEWTNPAESILAQGIHLRIAGILESTGADIFVDQLLGDDGAISFNGSDLEDSEIAQVINVVSKEFGLIANPDKQRIDVNTLTYLQRFFDKDITVKRGDALYVAGSYPCVLALNTAMNPERFHDSEKWSKEMEILRGIMILENCNGSPYFHEMIKLLVSGCKYGLGTLIPGYFKRQIAHDYEMAKSMTGFVPSYTEAHTNRGIYDFDVVKFLMSQEGGVINVQSSKAADSTHRGESKPTSLADFPKMYTADDDPTER
jgi:hypothetical protein